MSSDGFSLVRKWGTYGLFILFAGWCVLAFKHDIAQIDLSTLRHAQVTLLAVAGLSLLNYALRVLRWRVYLKQLGHRFSMRFTALSFMAGFAFTLSPGKLGEIVRSRYYLPKGVSVGALTGAFFVER
ncbi:MAG TPA: lysylphosphatidylglycerol synthase domain-containing protein, partial [Aquabacterium sp.]|nr:lysylphosphatidylglycerol synthase domain-containing protein [Aquabacterium sp.]